MLLLFDLVCVFSGLDVIDMIGNLFLLGLYQPQNLGYVFVFASLAFVSLFF